MSLPYGMLKFTGNNPTVRSDYLLTRATTTIGRASECGGRARWSATPAHGVGPRPHR